MQYFWGVPIWTNLLWVARLKIPRSVLHEILSIRRVFPEVLRVALRRGSPDILHLPHSAPTLVAPSVSLRVLRASWVSSPHTELCRVPVSSPWEAVSTR